MVDTDTYPETYDPAKDLEDIFQLLVGFNPECKHTDIEEYVIRNGIPNATVSTSTICETDEYGNTTQDAVASFAQIPLELDGKSYKVTLNSKFQQKTPSSAYSVSVYAQEEDRMILNYSSEYDSTERIFTIYPQDTNQKVIRYKPFEDEPEALLDLKPEEMQTLSTASQVLEQALGK